MFSPEIFTIPSLFSSSLPLPLPPGHFSPPPPTGDVENPFCMADMMDQLRRSDKTKAYMEDQAFVAKLEELSKDPNRLIR